MRDRLREELWAVVESCVAEGVSPKEFKQEAAECWEQALRDRLRDEPAEVRK